MIKGKNLGIVSMDTGEMIASYEGGVRVQTEEEIESTKKYYESIKPMDQKFGRISSLYEKRGTFIWNIHSSAKILFPEIKPATLTRLMFLSTYLGYDGYLVDAKKKPITKNELQHYLEIHPSDCRKFWKDIETSKLMYESDGKIYLDNKMFARGKFPKDKIKDLAENEQCLTRIYISGVRKLYNTATVPSHTTLSYIFRILPYVNREYNVCCFNPLETDKSKIQLMPLGDFADVIGYDRAHISRLAKTLFEPIFEVNGTLKNAIRYVSTSGFNKDGLSIFINPCVYYAGAHWKDIEILGCF